MCSLGHNSEDQILHGIAQLPAYASITFLSRRCFFFNIVSQNVGVVPTLLGLARLAHGLVPLFAVRVRRVRFRSRGGARLADAVHYTADQLPSKAHSVVPQQDTECFTLTGTKKCTTMVLLLWFKHES